MPVSRLDFGTAATNDGEEISTAFVKLDANDALLEAAIDALSASTTVLAAAIDAIEADYVVAADIAGMLETSDIGSTVQAADADLDTWAAITRASGFDAFVATPSSDNLAALLTDETGSGGGFVRATSPTLSGVIALLAGTALSWDSGDVSIAHSAGQLSVDADTILIGSQSGSGGHSLPQLVLRSNDTVTPDGAGAFIRFQSPSSLGTQRDATQINGGLVDATDGAENAVFDLALYRGGASEVALTLDAATAALFPGATNNVYALGKSGAAWSDLFLGDGSVIDWGGDLTLTHSANALGLAGGSFNVTNAAATSGIGGMALSVTQTSPNAGDTADSALSLAWGLTANSATNELVARVFRLTASNTLTGGGALQNLRIFDLSANANASTATGECAGMYIAAGTASGTVTTGRAIHIASWLGTDKYGIYDESGGNWFSAGWLRCLGATAVPAGGTTGVGLMFSSTANLGVFFGSGAPTLAAAKGSIYLRTDGSGTSDRAYVNTDGSTSWTALTTAA